MRPGLALALIVVAGMAQTERPRTDPRSGGTTGTGPAGLPTDQGNRSQQPAQAEYNGPRSTVSGTVLDSITGTPVKSARVHLFPMPPRGQAGSMARMGPTRPISVVTSADGRFTALNLQPGTYMVSAIHPRYSTSRRGPRPESLELRPGETKDDVVLRLTPGGVVTGRVLDQDGDPIQHAPVTLYSAAGTTSATRLVPAGSGQTNDLGEYRIHGIADGKYYAYVRAMRPALMPSPLLPKSAPALVTQAYEPVFYPAAPEPGTASVVAVAPGAEVTGIDFRLKLTAVSTIKGTLLAPQEAAKIPVQIQLVPRDSSFSMDGPGFHTVTRNGSFEFRLVTPGAYKVRAHMVSRESTYSGSADVVVRADRPLENVTIPLIPAAEVSGRFILEGGTMPDRMHASLQPKEGNFRGPHPNSRLEPDGTFKLKAPAGTYSLPSHFGSIGYIKSVTLNGQPTDPDNIVIGEGGGQLEVVLSPKTAVVEGTLEGEFAGNVMILAYPESGRLERPLMTMGVPASRSFTLRSMPPGHYRIAAVTGTSGGFDPRSRTIFDAVQKHGSAISVAEEDRKTVNLRIVDLNQ